MKIIKKALLIFYLNLFFPIINLFAKKDTYVFLSFMGLKAAGDPLVFYEYIRKKYPDAICIWLTSDSIKEFDNVKNKNTKFVKLTSFKLLSVYLHANIAISNGFFPYLFWKNKGAFYIETWHASPQYKYALLDVVDSKIERFFFKKYIKNTDLVVSGNELFEKYFVLSSAMNYTGEILRIGSIRNEALFRNYDNDQEIMKIKALQKDRKTILFAPTYRDYSSQNLENAILEFIDSFNSNELYKDYLLLIRNHHLTKMDIISDNNVIDVSNISSSEKVMSISDLLITDYSSICFDFASMKKPFILYQFDIDEYTSNRKLYFKNPKEELGVSVVYTNEQLIKEIKEIHNDIINTYKFKVYENDNSCERLEDYILKRK